MPGALYHCVVRHARVEPLRHSFAHRTYQWLVDLDDLPRHRVLARFEARDHLGDPAATIRANVDALLAGHGLRATRVLMLANARVLGYVFNPLSVYWCFDGDALAGVIAEVHNTYGERHAYVLRAGDGTDRYRTDKRFYVSPFYEVAGVYRMRLPVPGERLSLSIEMTPPGGKPFVATVAGRREPASVSAVLRSAIRYPWATLVVSLRIRWHGVRLFARGLPVVPRPPAIPQEGVQ
jgi:DUF1365 family protein